MFLARDPRLHEKPRQVCERTHVSLDELYVYKWTSMQYALREVAKKEKANELWAMNAGLWCAAVMEWVSCFEVSVHPLTGSAHVYN